MQTSAQRASFEGQKAMERQATEKIHVSRKRPFASQ